MNFKRIEWIFLIAFIALDIFLIGAYYNQNGVQTESDTSSSRTTNSVMRSLKDDQISYPANLSNKEDSAYYIASPNSDYLEQNANKLSVDQTSYEKADRKLTVTLDRRVKIKDLDHPDQSLDSVVNDESRVLEGEKYRYDRNLSNSSEVVYTQMVYGKSVPSEQGQLKFDVKGGYVTGYSQSYLENIQILREKKPTISEKRALIWLYQYNKLPANSKVNWGQLGYTKLLSVNGSTVYIPTWVFSVKTGGNTIYRRINAFNGAVMDQ